MAESNLLDNNSIINSIQKRLLRRTSLSEVEGLGIVYQDHFSPEPSGDFFEIFHPAPHIVDFVIGDVIGSGAIPILIATMAKDCLNYHANPLVSPFIYEKQSGWVDCILRPDQIIRLTGNLILETLEEIDHYICLFYGRLDLREGILQSINLGFPLPSIIREEKEVHVIQGRQEPLGLLDNLGTIQISQTTVKEGDKLVFHSDGLVKALKGEKETASALHQLRKIPLHSMIDGLYTQYKSNLPSDDLILFGLQIESLKLWQTFGTEKIAKFHSDLNQLKFVRKFVTNFIKDLPHSTEQLQSLCQIVVNEVFANIARHGSNLQKGCTVSINLSVLNGDIVIKIDDNGAPFDPKEIEFPNFSGEKEEGFGFFLVKEIADKISYTKKLTKEGVNRFCIVKRLPGDEERMELTKTLENGILIITPIGENLDAKEAPSFKEKMSGILEREKFDHLVFDLHNVHFVDSTGLGAFLSVLKKLSSEGKDMKLACITKSIKTILELVCMDKIFAIYPTVDEAIKSWNPKK